MSMWKKYVGNPSLVVPMEDVCISNSLSYEDIPMEIFDRRVCRLKTKDVSLVKVLWRNYKVEEATWEVEEDMKSKYPIIPKVLDPANF